MVFIRIEDKNWLKKLKKNNKVLKQKIYAILNILYMINKKLK